MAFFQALRLPLFAGRLGCYANQHVPSSPREVGRSKGSGKAMATVFSNTPGSWQTSLGFCITAEGMKGKGVLFIAGPSPFYHSKWLDEETAMRSMR